MPSLALTDLGNMFGSMEFFQKCQKSPVKPIIGCEVYLAPQGLDNPTNMSELGNTPHQLVLLAKNYPGYKNLIK